LNGADIVAILLIIVFGAVGSVLGSIRTLIIFLGMFFAYSLTNGMISGEDIAPKMNYIGTYLGIFIGSIVIALLVYGYSKATIIESMEGVFGFILGALTGWGIAKFIFTIFLVYHSDTSFAAMIGSGTIAWQVFNVGPYQAFLDRTKDLREPKTIY